MYAASERRALHDRQVGANLTHWQRGLKLHLFNFFFLFSVCFEVERFSLDTTVQLRLVHFLLPSISRYIGAWPFGHVYCFSERV